MNEDLPESVGEHVLGVLGGTVTDVGHLVHSLEAPANPVVDTLGPAPIALELAISVALMASELLGSLLHDLRPGSGCDSHG